MRNQTKLKLNFKTMAEIMENTGVKYATNSKANAALSLGIIGTALAGLTAIGGGVSLLGGNNTGKRNSGTMSCTGEGYNDADLTIERKQCQNYLDVTKQYYEGKLGFQRELTDAFFAAYDRDIKNSFDLYKYSRDSKDELSAKIAEVNSKVDIMAAIRPYQDALINQKIDNVALVGDYNLARRTCRMIQGELVLPSTPTVTGLASYNGCNCTQTTTTTTN